MTDLLRPLRLGAALCWLCTTGCLANSPSSMTATSGNSAGANGNPDTASSDVNPGNTTAVTPFAPISLQAGARKIKMLLTGEAVLDSEYKALGTDSNNLGDLVDTWMKSPGYQITMQRFLSDALHQNMANGGSLSQVNAYLFLGDGIIWNLRDSLALTMMHYINAGEPFTKIATTKSFMMTTAMMAALAYNDMEPILNDGTFTNKWMDLYPDLKITFQDKNPNITTDQSTDPSDPNFGIFYYPGLTSLAGQDSNCNPFPGTITWDPQGLYSGWTWGLYLKWTWQGLQYTTKSGYDCQLPYNNFGQIDADFNDWRMVTVRKPQGNERTDTFMQMDRLRKSNEIILSTPRVGYFTTMPFLATWQTNVSNQARVTMNEAMIVGLNQAFDGTNGTMAGVLPGLDSTHGNPSSPCFSCHRNLDPMRMFYLHELTNFWSPQTDETMAAVPPTFAFNSAPVTGSSLYDLGDQIAANPGFAAAWTQKLCMWANSRPCVPTDPEFVRVAEAFKASSYNWSVLVKTLMTSPLITYQADSPTADSTGGLISLSRRDHLCRTLNARLNMDDLCAQSGQIGATTGSPLTTALPADGVIRGAVYASAPTATTMNYRTMVENLCINAANRAIDGQLVPDLGNQDPNVALHFLATGLMGLSASEAATPTQILTQHYTDALAAASADPNGSDAAQTIAIKSAFVLACTSPFVTAIGF